MEKERERKKKGMKLLDLPEGCLSYILSLTSPAYVLRSSLVCKIFHSLANSDFVWESFLPSDLDSSIIQRCSSTFPSTRYLVLHLCRSFVLLDGHNMSFSLDKWSGKKCYMLGARELEIGSSDNPRSWSWKPLSESRFPEVAELLCVDHIQITGKITTQLLSPNTSYHAYFLFKLKPWSRGFDVTPVIVLVRRVDSKGAYINNSSYNVFRTFYLKAPEGDSIDTLEDDRAYMNGRDVGDRWLKIDMGKYYNRPDDNVAALEMTLTVADFAFHMSGLIVYGIELLPLD